MNDLVVYLGNDEDFVDSIKGYYGSFKTISISVLHRHFSARLFDICSSRNPNIIFIDFSDPLCITDVIITEVLEFRRFERFDNCLFVALFKDEAQRNSFPHIYTAGFKLAFIKGVEHSILFRDCFYIGFKQKIDFPVLAQFNGAQKKLQVNVCSSLRALSLNEAIIETTIPDIKDRLPVTFSIFPDLKCDSFEIVSSSSECYYPLGRSYRVKLPLAGPWDDDGESVITEATVETWLSLNEKNFILHPDVIVSLLSQSDDYLQGYSALPPEVLFKQYNTTKIFEDILIKEKPSIIFVDLDKDPEGELNLSKLEPILGLNSLNLEHLPIIIVSNCPSTGIALQKSFNYPFIMAFSTEMKWKIIQNMVKTFLEKKSHLLQRDKNLIRPECFKSSVNLKLDIVVTSLTEHEMTFISDTEIPLYTVLSSDLPISFSFIVVPPTHNLKKHKDRFHYMAFINNLSEEELTHLRKIVNQLIYNHTINFDDPILSNANFLKPLSLDGDKETSYESETSSR